MPFENVFSGECLISREEFLDSYKKSISQALENSEKFSNESRSWAGSCWDYTNDHEFSDYELTYELGNVILQALKDPKVPDALKNYGLKIAKNAIPQNIFFELVKYIEDDGKIYRKEISDILFIMWIHHSKSNPKIAKFDIKHFLKKYRPEFYTPPYIDLYFIFDYFCIDYPYDYPAAKKILIDLDLFNYKNNSAFYCFQDPRAREDANYFLLPIDEKSRSLTMYLCLIRHLELEFKRDWLEQLNKYHLRLLRNGIHASYGYKFKDTKLQEYYDGYQYSFCRYGVCGINNADQTYNEAMLTEIDKKNLALIGTVEKNKK